MAISHSVGKSGQEALWLSRNLAQQKKIRPMTLLATRFSKWSGGHQGNALDTAAFRSYRPRLFQIG